MNINHLRWKDALHNLESSLNDLPASVPTPVMVLTMVTMVDDHNKNDDGNGSVVVGAMVAMVMLMVLLFKGILGHGSEVGFWSILDGDGSSLGVLCQPH